MSNQIRSDVTGLLWAAPRTCVKLAYCDATANVYEDCSALPEEDTGSQEKEGPYGRAHNHAVPHGINYVSAGTSGFFAFQCHRNESFIQDGGVCSAKIVEFFDTSASKLSHDLPLRLAKIQLN